MDETLAITGPIAAIALAVILCRSILTGATLVLAMTLAKAWFVDLPGIELGVMLYPTDALALLLALAASLRIIANQSIRVPPSGLIFTATLMLSFLIGLTEFGKAAGVDFRITFAFIAGVFYFCSFDIDSELTIRLLRVWIITACALMLIAWFVWIIDAAGLTMAKKWIDADPTGVKFRVLNASITYVIGVGLVVLLHLFMNGEIATRWWPVLLALCGTVLALQHRSVWTATLVSAALVVLLAQRGRARVFLFAGAVAVLAIAVAPLISHRLSAVSESVSLQAERATDMTKGTSGGRIRAWDQLLNDWKKLGLGQQLIGKPFGSSYGGLTNAPHNCYLQVMYRTGYVGLLAMLWMYGSTLIRLLGIRDGTAEETTGVVTLLFALIVGQLVYFVPYAFTPEHGILMGTAIGCVWRKPFRQSVNDVSGQGLASEDVKQPINTGDLKQKGPLLLSFSSERMSGRS
jgi:O-Antigen ligase